MDAGKCTLLVEKPREKVKDKIGGQSGPRARGVIVLWSTPFPEWMLERVLATTLTRQMHLSACSLFDSTFVQD